MLTNTHILEQMHHQSITIFNILQWKIPTPQNYKQKPKRTNKINAIHCLISHSVNVKMQQKKKKTNARKISCESSKNSIWIANNACAKKRKEAHKSQEERPEKKTYAHNNSMERL